MGDTLSAGDIAVVKAVATAVSALSCCGSTAIIAAFLRYRHLRRFAFLLVCILSACDILNQVSDFISPDAGELAEMAAGGPTTASCYAQAVLDSFFELASVMWTSAIATTLYLSVFRRMSADDVAAKLPLFAAINFGVPLVLTIAPWFDGAYGPSGGWCWIVEAKQYWRALQFYIPLWVVIVYNAVTYVRVVRLLRRTVTVGRGGGGGGGSGGGGSSGGSGGATPRPSPRGGAAAASAPAAAGDAAGDATAAAIRRIVVRLQAYPFILLIVYLPATVNRIAEVAMGGRQVFALFLLQRAFSSSQGLCNAIAYGLSDGVREAVAADARALVTAMCGARASERWLGAPRDGGASVGSASGGGGSSGGGRSPGKAPRAESSVLSSPSAALPGGGVGSSERRHTGPLLAATAAAGVDVAALVPPPSAASAGAVAAISDDSEDTIAAAHGGVVALGAAAAARGGRGAAAAGNGGAGHRDGGDDEFGDDEFA